MTRRELEAACRKAMAADPKIMGMMLFGSRARGTARAGSDWDVGVFTEGGARPALGEEVEAHVLDARVLAEGTAWGSLAHSVLEEGTTLAWREGNEAVKRVTRDVNARLVKDEIEAAVGTIRSALKEWRHEAGAENARERGWRWRQEMRRATTDSAVAAELVARNVCLASGVAPAGGHDVAKMGQDLEAAGYEEAGVLVEGIDGQCPAIRVTHYGGEYATEPQAVWLRRAGRTLHLLLEARRGCEGEGPLAHLKEMPDAFAKGLREALKEVGAIVGEAENAPGSGAPLWTRFTRAWTERRDGRTAIEGEDPFGPAERAKTARDAVRLGNAEVLEATRSGSNAHLSRETDADGRSARTLAQERAEAGGGGAMHRTVSAMLRPAGGGRRATVTQE